MAGSRRKPHDRCMTNIQPTNTTAFYAQSAISFAVSFAAVLLGVAYLPGDGWMRAFLAVSLLYVVTSTFTLAKCVRDQPEQTKVVQRVDEVRLEKLLAEHDPFQGHQLSRRRFATSAEPADPAVPHQTYRGPWLVI